MRLEREKLASQAGKKKIKIVVVGDTAVGKTCLIRNYLYNDFNDDYVPSVLDIWEATKTINGKEIELQLVDTSGDPYLQLDRQLKYSKADGFMICSAANAVQTLESVGTRWVQEISVVQTAPMLLILTKKDLIPFLEEAETEHITEQMVTDKAREMNFTGHSFTSAKEWQDFNVHKAFDDAIEAAYYQKYGEDL